MGVDAATRYKLSKRLGVNGFCEFVCMVVGVIGLELIIDFALSNSVYCWSSFNSRFLVSEVII